jgi:hypothetical protein
VHDLGEPDHSGHYRSRNEVNGRDDHSPARSFITF